MSKPVIDVAVALVRRDTRWLVARRRPDAHLGGLWEFPGGKCEPHERPAATAIRELREECGIHAVVEQTLDPIFYAYPDRGVNITPVLCCWQAGAAQSVASEATRWVSLAELRQLEMPPANADIIRQLEQAL
jgi:8-oxo-dGTP diphosphatase